MQRVALVLLAVILTACSRTEPPSNLPSGRARDTEAVLNGQHGTTFRVDVPSGWTKEDISGGLLLVAPTEEAGWQANVFLETRTDLEQRPITRALDELIGSLVTHKQHMRVLQSGVRNHPRGYQYGFISYTHVHSGVTIQEREIVVPVGRDVLFVVTSAAASVAQKYEPVFASLLESIRHERPAAV